MAFTIPVRKVAHVYVAEIVAGVKRFVRANMNVVSLDRGDSAGPRVYIEPAEQAVIPRASTVTDPAAEIRVYDAPPFPGSDFGQS